MRILIYGMQSSGASLITYFLGQRSDHMAIIDLHNEYLCPDFDTDNVIVKCTVSAEIDFEEQVRAFRPDIKVLVIRDPLATLLSLVAKNYKDVGGSPTEKIQKLDQYYQSWEKTFDILLFYEDFMCQTESFLRAVKNIATKQYYKFERSLGEILLFNCEHSEWCRKYIDQRWGMGNIHPRQTYFLNHQSGMLATYKKHSPCSQTSKAKGVL